MKEYSLRTNSPYAMSHLRWLIGFCVCWWLIVGIYLFGWWTFGADGWAEEFQPASLDLAIEQIYENPDFLPLINVQQAKVTLQDLASSLQQLQVDYEQVDTKRIYLEERFDTMMQSIEKTLFASQQNKELITTTLTKIGLLESNIASMKNELQTMKNDVDSSRAYIQEYVLFLYQSYHQLYGPERDISLFKQLIDSREVEVSLNAQHFAEMLTKSLQDQLVAIQVKQEEYLEKTKQLNAAKVSYYQSARLLKKDLERLTQQKQYLYAQLRALQTDKATLDKRASELSLSQEELQDELQRVQTMTLEWQQQTSAAVSQLLDMVDRPVGKNYLTWPVLPVMHIDTFFGNMVIDAGKESRLADYLRIELPQWELVAAAAPGLVYKVIDSDDGSENWIILLHKKWFVTMYRPLEKTYVQEWAVVKRGQPLWRTGGQPWTRWAGIQSAGPHFDFSVYLNGEPLDPFAHLDLSILDNKHLPSQRQQKYLDDLFAREVPLDNLPLVRGNSIAERRDDFLRRYASAPYNDAALWYDASEWTWIDPILGMCIGFSETSFRNFKSENNIGNVGNNDRGDVVVYESPVAGARALYGVLNNQYLGWYHTLNELSRFGNHDGFIYASSPYNRQRNVMRCMAAIYGYSIPEDYPFRRPIE